MRDPKYKRPQSKVQNPNAPQSKIQKSKRPQTKIQNPNGLFGFWFWILDGYVETAFHESQTGRSLDEPNLTLLFRIKRIYDWNDHFDHPLCFIKAINHH